MAYSLNFSGGAILIPKITFTGDFSVTIKATQIANGRFFFGSDNTAGSLELYRNNSGQAALYIGTVGQFSGATALSNNVDLPDTIVIARAGAAVTVHVNGVLQGSATFSGSMHINQIGLRQGWGNYPAPMRLYLFDLQDLAAPSNSRTYDPSLSAGSGSTLPTKQGGNYGTQSVTWPADDTEWFYYQGAIEPVPDLQNIWRRYPTGKITPSDFIPRNNSSAIVAEFWELEPFTGVVASSVFTMPQLSVAAVASDTEPSGIALSVAFAMPQMSVAIAASKTAPAFAASSAFTMPQFAVSVSASKNAPTFAASASVTMPQLAVASLSSASQPGYAASVAFAMPQLSVAVSASKTTPTFAVSSAFVMPQMSVAATLSNTAPIVSGLASFNMPQMAVNANAQSFVSGLTSTVRFAMPQLMVAVSFEGAAYHVADGALITQYSGSRTINQSKRSSHIEAAGKSTLINKIEKSRFIAYNYQSTHIEQRI